jgi:hypothetical protein
LPKTWKNSAGQRIEFNVPSLTPINLTEPEKLAGALALGLGKLFQKHGGISRGFRHAADAGRDETAGGRVLRARRIVADDNYPDDSP